MNRCSVRPASDFTFYHRPRPERLMRGAHPTLRSPGRSSVPSHWKELHGLGEAAFRIAIALSAFVESPFRRLAAAWFTFAADGFRQRRGHQNERTYESHPKHSGCDDTVCL